MAEHRLRSAVRGLVLAPDDRVLLVQFRSPDEEFWATPGGGVDPGETPIDALRRELHEEVGAMDLEIGPPIWTRSVRFDFSEIYDGQTETIFLVHAGSPRLGPALLTETQLRAEGLVDRAWWSVSQLHATTAVFAPTRLPTLVTDLIASGPPGTPIDVGI